MFSEFPNSGGGLTPYLVDLPGSNEASQEKLANVAELNVETATAFLYVMTYNELRNKDDFDTVKAIYDRDRRKSFTLTVHPSLVIRVNSVSPYTVYMYTCVLRIIHY